jgi:hypothetical protein
MAKGMEVHLLSMHLKQEGFLKKLEPFDPAVLETAHSPRHAALQARPAAFRHQFSHPYFFMNGKSLSIVISCLFSFFQVHYLILESVTN